MRPTISSRPGGRAQDETRRFSHVRINIGAEKYKQITVQLGTRWLSSGEEYINFFQLSKKKKTIRPPLQWCHMMMDYTLDRHVPSKHTCGSPLLRDMCKKTWRSLVRISNLQLGNVWWNVTRCCQLVNADVSTWKSIKHWKSLKATLYNMQL